MRVFLVSAKGEKTWFVEICMKKIEEKIINFYEKKIELF